MENIDIEKRAKELALQEACWLAFETDPSIEQTNGWEQLIAGHESDWIDGYAKATREHLILHEESLRFLKKAAHGHDCEFMHLYQDGHVMRMHSKCTCGLEDHLTTLRTMLGTNNN